MTPRHPRPDRWHERVLQQVRASPIGWRLLSGTFWSLGGAFVPRFLELLLAVIVARWLGKVGFGEYSSVLSTIFTVSLIAGLGLGTTATRYIATSRGHGPQQTGQILSFVMSAAWISGGIFAVAFWLSAPWLAERVLDNTGLTHLLRVGTPWLAFGVVSGVQGGVMIGFEEFRRLAVFNTLAYASLFLAVVAGAHWNDLTGAFWGLSAGGASTCLIMQAGVRRIMRERGLRFEPQAWQTLLPLLWRYSLPIYVSSLLTPVVSWLCLALVVRHPQGYAEVAVYNAIMQWFVVVSYLASIVAQASFPVFAERVGQGDSASLRRLLLAAIAATAALVVPIIAIGSWFSAELMGIYGHSFVSAHDTLPLALVAAGIFGLAMPAAQLVISSSGIWKAFGVNLAWGALTLGLGAWWLDRGAEGLYAGRLAGCLVYAIGMGILAMRTIRLVSEDAHAARTVTPVDPANSR